MKLDYWINKKISNLQEINSKQQIKSICKRVNEVTDKYIERTFTEIHKEIAIKDCMNLIWKDALLNI